MIKFFIFLLFMIPLIFNGYFWLTQVLFLLVFFLFVINFCFSWEFLSLGYLLGCDLLSFSLILLTFWICSLMVLARSSVFYNYDYCSYFLFFILFIFISLFFVFSSLNLFLFYLFFEISLIPVLFLILGWGYQPERIQAGYYLMFYTLFSSLPMMVAIFYLYNYFGTLVIVYFNEDINSFFLFICLNFVFFIKSPIYLVHLWLPKAHVEAPVAGSIILAGVMLKLGTYGFMRLLIIFSNIILIYGFYFIVVSLLGGILVSLICLRQRDIKSLIAYSSVVHIGLVLGGILTLTCWGFCGSFIIIIAHGLCSSGLFCLSNIFYERLVRRSFFLSKGLLNIMPGFSLWIFMFCVNNISSPPSLNLLGEIILINRLIFWRDFTFFCLVFISFFAACYCLYLYSFTQHGSIILGFNCFSGFIREYLLLFLHWFPLNFLFLKRDFLVWRYLSSLLKIVVCGTTEM